MIFSMMSSRIVSLVTSGLCWVETTTASTRTGLVAVVFDRDLGLAVGAQVVERRRRAAAHERPLTSLCASMIGSGISSSVSVQAKPNISPWSPAPPVSTPMRCRATGCEWPIARRRCRRRSRTCARVADLGDGRAHDVLIVEHGVGRDFAGDDGQAGRHERFAGDAADRDPARGWRRGWNRKSDRQSCRDGLR